MSRFEEMRETKREGNGNLVSTEYIYRQINNVTTFILG
jgi:hypothetical protein